MKIRKEVSDSFINKYIKSMFVEEEKFFIKTRSPLSEARILRQVEKTEALASDKAFQVWMLESKKQLPVIIADGYGIERNQFLLSRNITTEEFEMFFKHTLPKTDQTQIYKINIENSIEDDFLHADLLVEDNEIALIYKKFEENEFERN